MFFSLASVVSCFRSKVSRAIELVKEREWGVLLDRLIPFGLFWFDKGYILRCEGFFEPEDAPLSREGSRKPVCEKNVSDGVASGNVVSDSAASDSAAFDGTDSKENGFRFRPASSDDLPTLLMGLNETDSGSLAKWFERCAANGNLCYLAEKEGRVAGYLWFFPQKYSLKLEANRRAQDAESFVDFEMNAGAGFIGNVFVQPEFRRQGVYGKLLDALRQQGVLSAEKNYFYSVVAGYNRVSLAAHKRLGFESVGTVCQIGCCTFEWVVLKAQRRRTIRSRLFPGRSVSVRAEYWEKGDAHFSVLQQDELSN